TVAPGGQASYTVATSIAAGAAQSIALAVTGLPAGVTGAFDAATVTAGGSATLTLTAQAGAGPGTPRLTGTGTAASGTHAAVATITVGANLLQNGDFEDGTLDFWRVTRGNVTNVNINPHGGARSMKVGRSSGVDSRSVVAQDITVPAGGTTTLAFWMYPRCEDPLDVHFVSIVDSGVFDDLVAGCSDSRAWAAHSFDITRSPRPTLTLL